MDTPNSSPEQQIPQPLPTFLDEVSFFVRRLPAWLFAFVALAGIFILYQFVGGFLTLLLFGSDLAEGEATGFRIATMAGQIVFLLIPTILLARLRFPHVRNVFRFGQFKFSHILLTIIAVFALQQLLQTYLVFQEAVPIEFPPVIRDVVDKLKQMMEQLYRTLTAADTFGEFLFVVVVIAVTPAVCEEMLFRGLIQRTLEEPAEGHTMSADDRKRRGFAAAVIAGVIFGVYHLNPFTLVPLAALGVYFGYVVYRTGNIMTAIAAHFFNNFIACLAIYLRLDENFIAISPTGRPGTGMLALNVAWSAVVFIGATYYLVRITSRTDVPPPDTASG